MSNQPIPTDTVTLGYRRPQQLASFPDLLVAESTRQGGRSTFPYSSMNLGLYSKDEPTIIQQNRDLFFERLGISEGQAAGLHQVHGTDILLAEQAGQYKGFDALITQRAGLFLTATVADCTPVLLFDPKQRAVAAIHAGWRGTVAHIVVKTLEAMQQNFGTAPEDCYAYVGTCIDECSFEVDADVADHFTDPFKRWDEEKQKFFVDLKTSNVALLKAQGVPLSQIEISRYSTVVDNEAYFSYRKEKGSTGRMLAVIGLNA